jgi:rubrerythrin
MIDQIKILNLYRVSEMQGACAAARMARLADTSELRANFTRHMRDEAKHAHLFAHVIEELGGALEDVDDPYQAHLRRTFGLPKSLTELLALTWVLEQRGVKAYSDHLMHAETPPEIARVLEAIMRDERWHVGWISAELKRRRKRGEARAVDDALARAGKADRLAVAAVGESLLG